MAVEQGQVRDPGARMLIATSPVTGEVIGRVQPTPAAEAPTLYKQARAAQRTWGAASVKERVRLLRRLRLVFVERLEEIARRVAESTGKTEAEVLVTEALLVLGALDYVEKHGPRVLRRHHKPTPIFLAGKHSYIEYRPKGVVLVIAPWNFPLQLALVPVIYALAAGNAVILKPSEAVPLVGVLIDELLQQADFPAHLVQVAHGEGELGAALVTPDRVAGADAGRTGPNHIFFTGSIRTGKIIQAAAAKDLIPTTLELSGKDAMIVFADAPMERAVHGAVWGGFMNCGQVCVGVERLYVHSSIHDKFVQRLVAESGRLRLTWPERVTEAERAGVSDSTTGAGSRSGLLRADAADIGSMTFAPQVDIVREHVEDAIQRGATLVAGSLPHSWKGMFVPPLVLGNVAADMRIAREETFGPVVTVTPFDTEDEVVDLVNASDYGLNASVWTKDPERARRVTSRIESGGVAVNDLLVTLANHHLPFGGVKDSGLGANHGETGLKAFSHEKAIIRDRLGLKRDVHWFPYEGKAPLFVQLLRSYFRASTDWIGFLRAFVGLLRRSR